jgi:hypothetical protein
MRHHSTIRLYLARVPHWSLRYSDASLSTLLVLQCLMTFALVPLIAARVVSPGFTDIGLVGFAVVCATAYAKHIRTLVLLLGSTFVLLLMPVIWADLLPHNQENGLTLHVGILLAAFFFNFLITWLVTNHTFGRGQVTRHRIVGAVLVYLNVAVLFSILYDLLETVMGGSIRAADGGLLAHGLGQRRAELTYFSLATLTTCGYGDIVPVHPMLRSLATMEAMFGQLFPATFVARLVALHLASTESKSGDGHG